MGRFFRLFVLLVIGFNWIVYCSVDSQNNAGVDLLSFENSQFIQINPNIDLDKNLWY